MSPIVRRPLLESPYLQGMRRLPFVAFVEEALPPDVCDALVARIEAEAPAVAPITTASGPVLRLDVRNNERVIFDDVALAADLFARTRAFLPGTLEDGALVGYNERFRGYRYRGGQRFAPHFDGAYFRRCSRTRCCTRAAPSPRAPSTCCAATRCTGSRQPAVSTEGRRHPSG